jgi:hypothetical protein
MKYQCHLAALPVTINLAHYGTLAGIMTVESVEVGQFLEDLGTLRIVSCISMECLGNDFVCNFLHELTRFCHL